MSSSLPAEPEGEWSRSGSRQSSVVLHPSRWSLRARLLGSLVALLALVCLALGVASTLTLRHFLIGRLDTQLVQAGVRSTDAGGPHPDGGNGGGGDPRDDTGSGARFLLAPGQPAGALGARVVRGTVVDAGVLTENGALSALPAGAGATLAGLPAGRRPSTVTISGVGDFRVLANRTDDGDILITGLPLREANDTLYALVAVESGVAVGALLLAGVAGAVIVRRTLRPLHRVATLATRVSALPLARGEVELAERVPHRDTDPRTEVGQVGGALNLLLDHVGAALTARHASEMRVRQFVADASHELRTPLAAIRGYAELSRRSQSPVPDDVAYALDRVESETRRMTLLVEDLLLLARLDSGRPLDHKTVDLSSLVIDAVSDASAAGPDHSWRLDLPEEPVEVLGDQARLHQVLANLLSNARTHTPPGCTVTASLAPGPPGQVLLAVVDDGPGIPQGLLPHVFERFARGDTSRTRAAHGRPGTAVQSPAQSSGQAGGAGGPASTGLGLAIVHAIVHAHGGSVDVSSRPGRTAFVLRLPAPGAQAATARGRGAGVTPAAIGS